MWGLDDGEVRQLEDPGYERNQPVRARWARSHPPRDAQRPRAAVRADEQEADKRQLRTDDDHGHEARQSERAADEREQGPLVDLARDLAVAGVLLNRKRAACEPKIKVAGDGKPLRRGFGIWRDMFDVAITISRLSKEGEEGDDQSTAELRVTLNNNATQPRHSFQERFSAAFLHPHHRLN